MLGVVASLAFFSVVTEQTGAQGGRVIRAVNVGAEPGEQVTVSFELVSLGNESSTSFTVNFDSTVLSSPVAALGSGVPDGSVINTNVNNVAAGRLGILIDSTNTYATGTRQFMRITFNVAANAQLGLYPVTFGLTPTPKSVSSATGTLLDTTYVPGNVQIGSTAAGVEVSGRVLSPDGRGIRSATVSLTGPDGVKRMATTSSFGYYRFENIKSGESYAVGVSSKRYRFTTRILQIVDSLADLDFVGLE